MGNNSTRIKFFALMLCGLPAMALAQDQWKNVYSESAWTEREAWQKADSLIRLMSIDSGSRVADVGCHEGYMTLKLSKAVGSGGKVFAVDINPDRLDHLRNHLQKLDIHNVTTVTGLPENPRLPVNSLDAVLILDAYHEMKSHQDVLLNIKRSLKAGGRLVICDPIMEIRRGWSRIDLATQHELEMSFALDDLRLAGFEIVFTKDRFIDREKIKGDKMWVVVAVKRRR